MIDKSRGWQGPAFGVLHAESTGDGKHQISTVFNFDEKTIGILSFRQSAALKIINF